MKMKTGFFRASFILAMWAATPVRADNSVWIGGTGSWSIAGNWSPEGVPNSASRYVLVDNGSGTVSHVTMNINAKVAGMTVDIDDSVDIANGLKLTVGADALTNHGVVTISSSSYTTYLYCDGSQTIAGTGQIVMSDSSRNYLRPRSSGQTLTHAADHTIRGAGRLLGNAGDMVNRGTILAQGSVALTIDPQNAFVNEGVLRAEGSGGLAFAAGAFTNTGYMVEILDGSQLVIKSGATIYGGTLESAGSGRILPDNNATLDGVALAAGSVVTQANGKDVTFRGGLVNDATWNLSSSGYTTYLYFDGSQTLSGSGEVVMSNASNNRILPVISGQTLTHAADHTIRGSGNLLNNSGNFINHGRILALGSVGMTINPQAYFRNRPGGILGGTGTFVFSDDLLDNAGVIAPGLSIGTLTVNGDLSNTGSAVLDIELGGTASGESGLLVVQGSFALAGDLRVSLVNDFLPEPEDTFPVVSATELSGFFANAVPAVGNTASNVVTAFGRCDVTYDFESSTKTVTLSNIVVDPTLLRCVSIQATPVVGTVTFAPSSVDWLYTLQYRPSLTEDEWQNVPGQGPRPGIGRRDTMIDTNAPPLGFYRVLGAPTP